MMIFFRQQRGHLPEIIEHQVVARCALEPPLASVVKSLLDCLGSKSQERTTDEIIWDLCAILFCDGLPHVRDFADP